MNKTLTNLFIFTAGAAIGSVVTWKLVKDKYARLAREEVEEMREYYSRVTHPDKDSEEPEAEKETVIEKVPEFTEQERIDYANLANVYNNNNQEGGPATVQKPEVIPPSEFGEFGYPTVSLTLYADGVLEDEYFDVIPPEEIDNMIGLESLEHFGEYEDDSVFVRNDRLETDYEILKDSRNYADVPRRNPIEGYE